MILRGQVDFLARSQSPTAYRRSPLYTRGPLGGDMKRLPSRGAFTAAVSIQKTPGESLMFLYEIDELYDFAVSELAIPIKMV